MSIINTSSIIISVTPLMPMAVKVLNNGIELVLNVSIDYTNQKVFFNTSNFELDYLALERQILDFITPSINEAPKIPIEILKIMNEVKAGNYSSKRYGD